MSASPVNTVVIQQWIAEQLDIQRVKEKLAALGYDEETTRLHLAEFKKIKYGKRQFAGFVYLAIGAVLGFISCILTVFNPVPELYNWILFGLTSVAVLIIFLGLYYLLE
ncbi:MAG TPA: hypothetical protein PKD93_04040 [Ferruginibacter sp.]|nr:hypothetical protein [Ferruginibacter sp.]MBN8698346.1 hypothetical protein [Chitinophagales bacterium]HMU71880.1 hypothetical protein [Ferruginibacter sp.]HMW26399.1 hypothetical protein [Ferruginibacter sp.]HMX35870.1 hypothetical protein [Ferruginibacter sp.]